jgi:PAS domain S-box-containing protein
MTGGGSNTFEHLLKYAPDGVVVVDQSGEIVAVNQRAELMFGYAGDELIGQPVELLLPDRLQGIHEPPRSGCSSGPGAGPAVDLHSLSGVRKDGTNFPAEVSLSSVRTTEGSLTITGIRDASERLRPVPHTDDELHRQAIVAAMLTAEEAERSRIATALHDDTVQVMTATLLMLGRVAQAVERYGDADVQSLIADARTVVEEATERTRRLTFELRPAVLHERGVAHALTAMVEQAGREIGAEVAVSAPNDRFDWLLEELVYRTVQEAVANIRKHSHAHHITVSLERLTDRLAVVVADDGRGFDVALATDPSTAILHMGVHSMIERVRMAGGSIHIDSCRNLGTRVCFHLPLSRPDASTGASVDA